MSNLPIEPKLTTGSRIVGWEIVAIDPSPAISNPPLPTSCGVGWLLHLLPNCPPYTTNLYSQKNNFVNPSQNAD